MTLVFHLVDLHVDRVYHEVKIAKQAHVQPEESMFGHVVLDMLQSKLRFCCQGFVGNQLFDWAMSVTQGKKNNLISSQKLGLLFCFSLLGMIK